MGASKKKGRKRNSEGSAGGGWEIVYSGFVLILLCFFIMLSSFSTMEEAKVMQFVKSFVTAVSMMPRGAKFEKGLAVVSDSADMVDTKSELPKFFIHSKNLPTSLTWRKRLTWCLRAKASSCGCPNTQSLDWVRPI